MIDSLNQFRCRVEQLFSFFEDTEVINSLVGLNVHGDINDLGGPDILRHLARLRSSTTDRRIQIYVTGIILLYGLFEQYVEEILVAYLEELDSIIVNFVDMPEKIKKNHTSLSAQLLINRDLDKYRDRCSEKDIIQYMLSCVEGESCRLNALAFTDHKSNFRIESLNQFFESAGVSGISTRMKQATAFAEYKARKPQNQGVDNLPDRVVFADLDDLAWRRNIVAHGWPDDTLSIDMMKERTEFIFMLGESIYEVLQQDLFPYIVKHRCRVLPKPLKVFNNSIVCFHLESESIAQDSRIIVRRPDGIYIEGSIIKIEINHVQKIDIVAPPPVDVALSVNFTAKPNYQYFLLNI